MATPSKKAPGIKKLLDVTADRTNSIQGDRCIPAPLGCGGPAGDFQDAISRREYTISGLCQKCQDSVFGDKDSA